MIIKEIERYRLVIRLTEFNYRIWGINWGYNIKTLSGGYYRLAFEFGRYELFFHWHLKKI